VAVTDAVAVGVTPMVGLIKGVGVTVRVYAGVALGVTAGTPRRERSDFSSPSSWSSSSSRLGSGIGVIAGVSVNVVVIVGVITMVGVVLGNVPPTMVGVAGVRLEPRSSEDSSFDFGVGDASPARVAVPVDAATPVEVGEGVAEADAVAALGVGVKST
jgi:hypothetical protein